MIKKIIRSVINYGDTHATPEALIRNYSYLMTSSLSLVDETDVQIWQKIQDHVTNYAECPSPLTLQGIFEKAKDITTLDRLEEISALKNSYVNSDFEKLVDSMVASQKEQEMQVILRTASQILYEGMTFKEKGSSAPVTYKGHRDSMHYVLKNADGILASDRGFKTLSNVVYDTEEALREFDLICSFENHNQGIYTGLSAYDAISGGIKSGQLWTHAAFTGELKTTFALNWVYNAVFLLQHNVYYLSLEMPIEQLRRLIYIMHSQHPVFDRPNKPQLTYALVRDAEDYNGPITDEQADFYREVIADIEAHRGTRYGNLFIRSPDEEFTVPRLRADMEIIHKNLPLHMGVVDHMALMRPEKQTRNYYTDLNSIIRDIKRTALSFNNGERLPILGLLQINRQGKNDADKSGGVYRMSALADSNEAERSSDMITTSYLNNEHKANSTVLFGNLKNRDGEIVPPFLANIEWNTRRIYEHRVGDETMGLDALSADDLLTSLKS